MSYSLDSDIVENDANAPKKPEYSVDSRLLVPIKGHKYTMRLISIANAKSGRKSPFIVKWNHISVNKNMTTDSYETEFVTCPTTAYSGVSNPYDVCPCCTAAGQIWKIYEETKNQKDRQAFDKVKRRFAAFIPVLIVSNTESAEHNGKIKILTINNRQMYKELCQYLETNGKRQFFNGFDNPEAKNLVLDVTTNKAQDGNEYRRFTYSESISGKKLCNELTPEWTKKFLQEKIIPLRFDEDFMTPYDPDVMHNFYERRISPLMIRGKAPQVQSKPVDKTPVDDMFDIGADSTESNPSVSDKATKKKNKKVTEEVQEEIISSAENDKVESKPEKKIISDQELEAFLETV